MLSAFHQPAIKTVNLYNFVILWGNYFVVFCSFLAWSTFKESSITCFQQSHVSYLLLFSSDKFTIICRGCSLLLPPGNQLLHSSLHLVLNLSSF